MTPRSAGPVFGFVFFYVLVVGVLAPVVGVVYLEVRDARRARRRTAARRNVRSLDGKRLERRVLASRAGAR